MYAYLFPLFNAFFAICRLKLAPQDLPDSRFLLGFTLACYTLLVFPLIMLDMHGRFWPTILITAANIGFMVVFVKFALQCRGFAYRETQTLVALAGSGLVLTLLSLPVRYWLAVESVPSDNQLSVPESLYLLLFVWDIIITGHIMRHALAVPYAVGIIVALGYTWLMVNFLNILVPTLS